MKVWVIVNEDCGCKVYKTFEAAKKEFNKIAVENYDIISKNSDNTSYIIMDSNCKKYFIKEIEVKE